MLTRISAVLVTSFPALAQSPQWGMTATYNIPVSAGSEIAAGDLNGDGRADLVLVNSGPLGPQSGLPATIGRTQPNGTLSFAAIQNLNVDSVAIASVNNDVFPDLIAPRWWLAGNASGDFSASAQNPIFGSAGVVVASADMNGDGHNDAVVYAYPAVTVFLGAGNGTFQLGVKYSSCSGGQMIRLADLDGDGDIDVVVAGAAGGSQLAVHKNQGSGVLDTTLYSVPSVNSLAIGDLNGDSLPDLLLGTSPVRILWATPTGGYLVGPSIPNLNQKSDVADLDGDGVLDIVSFSSSPYGLVILRGLGAGSFAAPYLVPGSTGLGGAYFLIAANVSGDSRPELITTEPGGTSVVKVFSNLKPDCNHNGIDDPVEIAMGASTDCDMNGVPDFCQADCDNSGTADVCQISAQPSLDLDTDGNLDSCEIVGTPYCFGDGTGAACPCDPGQAGPSGGGCLNSLGGGGRLRAVGNAQVSLDSVTITATGMDTVAPGLLFQGPTTQASGLGSVFGDGLLCVSGTVTRLMSHSASGGVIKYGRAVPGDPALSFAGAVPPAGATVFYQVWYRDNPVFCTPAAYNMTNGVGVLWQP